MRYFVGRAIIESLLRLARARKKTLVVVTHDNNLAQPGDPHLANRRWSARLSRR